MPLSFSIPSREEIRNKSIEAFNIHPCEFQITDAIAQLQRKEVVTISPTGSRKTLTFWLPLLFNDEGIIIVITALNILGAQNVMELAKLGLPAVNVTADNTTSQLSPEANTTSCCATLVMCKARPKALSRAKPSPNRPGQARP